MGASVINVYDRTGQWRQTTSTGLRQFCTRGRLQRRSLGGAQASLLSPDPPASRWPVEGKTPQLRLRSTEASGVSRGRQSASLAGLCPGFPCGSSSFLKSPGSFSKRPDCPALDHSFSFCILQNQSFLFHPGIPGIDFESQKSEVSHALTLCILRELDIKGTWPGSFYFMRPCSFDFWDNMLCAEFFCFLGFFFLVFSLLMRNWKHSWGYRR